MKYAVTKCAADYHFIYNSIINNSLEALDIFFFKNVSSEVNERSSLGYQATNEIVQNPTRRIISAEIILYMWTIYLFDDTYILQFLCGPLMYCDALHFL